MSGRSQDILLKLEVSLDFDVFITRIFLFKLARPMVVDPNIFDLFFSTPHMLHFGEQKSFLPRPSKGIKFQPPGLFLVV